MQYDDKTFTSVPVIEFTDCYGRDMIQVLPCQKEHFKVLIAEVMKDVFKECMPKAEKKLYTRFEVCEKLHIKPATFDSMVKRGIIKAHKIGSRVFVDADDLDQAMKEKKINKWQRKGGM